MHRWRFSFQMCFKYWLKLLPVNLTYQAWVLLLILSIHFNSEPSETAQNFFALLLFSLTSDMQNDCECTDVYKSAKIFLVDLEYNRSSIANSYYAFLVILLPWLNLLSVLMANQHGSLLCPDDSIWSIPS